MMACCGVAGASDAAGRSRALRVPRGGCGAGGAPPRPASPAALSGAPAQLDCSASGSTAGFSLAGLLWAQQPVLHRLQIPHMVALLGYAYLAWLLHEFALVPAARFS